MLRLHIKLVGIQQETNTVQYAVVYHVYCSQRARTRVRVCMRVRVGLRVNLRVRV